jgi:hypothetical protein
VVPLGKDRFRPVEQNAFLQCSKKLFKFLCLSWSPENELFLFTNLDLMFTYSAWVFNKHSTNYKLWQMPGVKTLVQYCF